MESRIEFLERKVANLRSSETTLRRTVGAHNAQLLKMQKKVTEMEEERNQMNTAERACE